MCSHIFDVRSKKFYSTVGNALSYLATSTAPYVRTVVQSMLNGCKSMTNGKNEAHPPGARRRAALGGDTVGALSPFGRHHTLYKRLHFGSMSEEGGTSSAGARLRTRDLSLGPIVIGTLP